MALLEFSLGNSRSGSSLEYIVVFFLVDFCTSTLGVVFFLDCLSSQFRNKKKKHKSNTIRISMNFDEFLESLSKIKNIPLPAETSHFKMVPPFRQKLLKQQQEAIKRAKHAGVLALFYPDNNQQTKFVLILRKTYKGVHSAQVAFPGGKLETQDHSLQEAALRETFEEVGVPAHTIQVVRKVSQVYIPPSNFYVQPFVGITKSTPRFIKQDDEVEAIIEVNLLDFLDDESLVVKKVATSYSVEVEVPAFKLNDHVVWGATAMMLSEIKDLLKQLM